MKKENIMSNARSFGKHTVMLEKIYDEISDRTLSFGCILEVVEWDVSEGRGRGMGELPICGFDINDFPVCYIHETAEYETIYPKDDENLADDRGFLQGYRIEKVIGHPVMISDCLDWIEKIYKKRLKETYNKGDFDASKPSRDRHQKKNIIWYQGMVQYLNSIWEKKRMPIDKQVDVCIKFIYNVLLENETTVSH